MELTAILTGLLALIAAVFGAYTQGKRKGRAAEQADRLQQDRDLEDRVDAAINNSRLGGNDWRGRLHDTRRK